MSEPDGQQGPHAATDANLRAALEALRAVVQASMAFRRSFARQFDLTPTDMIAISHLAASDALGAGELAIRTGMPASSVTTVLDRLEHLGLVARTTAPGDRRSVTITFTDVGLAALRDSEAWTTRALLKVGPDNLTEFTRCLRVLAAELRRVATSYSPSDAKTRQQSDSSSPIP